MSSITIKEALNTIDTGKIVSIKYVSFDKKRKTGGKLKHHDELVVTNPKKITPTPTKVKSDSSPNHLENSTRNFFTCINGRPTSAIKKIHVFLILEVDGKTVMA